VEYGIGLGMIGASTYDVCPELFVVVTFPFEFMLNMIFEASDADGTDAFLYNSM